MPARFRSSFVLSILVFCIAVAETVAADTPDPDSIDEIVVFAQKREQSIQDVGISLTVFLAKDLVDLSLSNSIDIAAQTPNVSFGDGGESISNIWNIRGVSQNDFSLHQESPVAVYIDEAYVSFSSAQQFRMFDVERVEVARGPQGTLYGRNATGGLIHYITNKPGREFEARQLTEIGEDGLWRIEGAIGGPLNDTVSARIAGFGYSHDDFVTNLGSGGDARGRDEFGIRGAVLIEPNARTDILLSASFSEVDLNYTSVHRSAGFDADGGQFLVPADLDYWGTGPGNDVVGFRGPDDAYAVNTDTIGFFKPETTSVTGRISYDHDSFEVIAVSNFNSVKGPFREDVDLSPRAGLFLDTAQDNSQWSQEIHLSGEKGKAFWQVGAYYLERKVKAGTAFASFTPFLDDFAAGFGVTAPGDILAGYGDGVLTLTSDWRLETRNAAAFAQTEFELGRDVRATIGARYSRDDLDYRFVSVEDIDGIILDPASEFWGSNSFSGTDDDGEWSGKLQLDWVPSEQLLAYVSVSRGTKGAGFNAPFTGGFVAPFGGEVLTNYELGLKSTWMGGRAILNGSLFSYDYDGYQAFSFEGIAATIVNTDAEGRGLEVEAQLRLPGQLDLSFGAGYLDTEIVGGGVLPFAPEWSFNARLRKTWLLKGDRKIAVATDYNRADGFYSDAANNPAAYVDAQQTLNARIGLVGRDERWSAFLVGRNLTDESNLYSLLPIGTGWAGALYGRPRWVSVELTFSY